MDGTLVELCVAADMNCDGSVGFEDIDPFNLAVSSQQDYEAAYPYCEWLNGDLNGDLTVDFQDIDYFIDHIGDYGVRRVHTWDAENRLIRYGPVPGHEQAGDKKVEFVYDYQGRRVQKKVYNWVNGQWQTTPALDRKYVWSGWLMLLELNGLNGDAVVRKYTWGLDLAGQNGAQSGAQSGAPASGRSALEGAGGIGGLLAVEQPQGGGNPLKYLYLYDANGNVGQVIDPAAGSASASIKVKYEYDPYGRRTNPAMMGEYDQPFRFSTKYWDSETGLYNYGYRYYHPGLGRWISRDPIGEEALPNLYAGLGNNPASRVDPDGRQDRPGSQPTTQGSEGGCCGPEVGDHVRKALDSVQQWFSSLPKQRQQPQPGQRYRPSQEGVCLRIWDREYGWDIYDLAATGGSKKYFRPPYIEQEGCGTGKCEGTVKFDGSCYRAGELNYILYGRINRLCHDAVPGWQLHFKGMDGDMPIWEDDDGRRIYPDMWDEPFMIATILGYRLGQTGHVIPVVPSAPAGPGGTWCRVSWAIVGYHGWSEPFVGGCQVKKCGTGCCKDPYAGPAFEVRIGGEDVPH